MSEILGFFQLPRNEEIILSSCLTENKNRYIKQINLNEGQFHGPPNVQKNKHIQFIVLKSRALMI